MTTFISHPDHPQGNPHLTLRSHSETVSDRAFRLYRSDTETTRDYIAAIGYLHDFGKATPQFQAYIHPDRSYDGPEAERYHGRLGAYVTLYVLTAMGADDRDALAGTLAVARHHQRLPDAAQYLETTLAKTIANPESTVRAQIASIEDRWPSAADDLLVSASDGAASWSTFVERATDGSLADRLRQLAAESELTGWYPNPEQLPPRLYDRTLHYWGTLTLADKSHAAEVDEAEIFEYDTLDVDPLAEYISSLQAEDKSGHAARLNEWRETARTQALAGVHEWVEMNDPPQIATLTLPTGLGKTFTGLSCAFTLRDKLPASNPPPVVIYALPFTSIIEQTREHFENPDIWGASPRESALTVHHYLSETIVDTGSDEATSNATLLGESWRSGVVLTTFVQLFESLSGPANGASTKLPSLDNAIIILDEPQALPKDWWDGIRRELELLTTEFGAHIISMTATQPALLSPVATTSLLEAGAHHTPDACEHCTDMTDIPGHDVGAYFDAANRVSYRLDESALAHTLDSGSDFITHETAADRIAERAQPTTSVLAVCNTIASSRALTDCLNGEATRHIGAVYERLLRSGEINPSLPDAAASRTLRECGFEAGSGGWIFAGQQPPLFVGTFNSRYRPVDRRVLLRIATTLTTLNVPFAFVSTQAIEAGVDISFKTVYRDIAPLDSIVQAAGRCNRSFEWGPNAGTVTVWTLANPDDHSNPPPASYVYEQGVPGHLRLIADSLAEFCDSDPIPDSQLAYDGVTTYFDRLSNHKSVATTEIRDEINECRAATLGRRSLIRDYDTIDVVIGVTDDEKARITAVGDAFARGATADGYKQLQRCVDLRVSIPTSNADEYLHSLPRVDRRQRGTKEGIATLAFTGESVATYDVSGGGFIVDTTNAVDSQFTI